MNKSAKKILKIALPSLLFIVILSYTYYKTKDLLRGVDLKVEGITDGQVFEDPAIKITGSAKNAFKISINGREIFIDKEARFSESLVLLPGINMVTIKAEDKFGKKIEKDYQLILK